MEGYISNYGNVLKYQWSDDVFTALFMNVCVQNYKTIPVF